MTAPADVLAWHLLRTALAHQIRNPADPYHWLLGE